MFSFTLREDILIEDEDKVKVENKKRRFIILKFCEPLPQLSLPQPKPQP
jgi:hypothetical protein